MAYAAFNTISRSEIKNSDQVWTHYLSTVTENEKKRVILPDAFDGRVEWKYLLSPPLDQGFCSACWAFASSSALSDRFNIQSVGQLRLLLSPARLVLCNDPNKWTRPLLFEEDTEIAAGCSKGANLIQASTFLFLFGTFENSCIPSTRDLIVNWPTKSEIDKAKNNTGSLVMESSAYIFPALYKNQKESITCRSVSGPYGDQCDTATPTRDTPYKSVHESTRHARHWRAAAFYTLKGKDEIKYDLYKWGTVVTSMDITEEFESWIKSPTFDKDVPGGSSSIALVTVWSRDTPTSNRLFLIFVEGRKNIRARFHHQASRVIFSFVYFRFSGPIYDQISSRRNARVFKCSEQK